MSSRSTFGVAFVLVASVWIAGGGPALSQTADAAKPAEPTTDAMGVPLKSQRLDKHAAPWTVIWHTRLWTDVPQTQDFVKATHPDPKSLDYAPLVGKDPDRPKPRDAAGVDALRAELEGDIKRNAARGKLVTPVASMAAEPPPPAAKPPSRKAKRAAKAKAAKSAAADTSRKAD